jgi:hypothetical protein
LKINDELWVFIVKQLTELQQQTKRMEEASNGLLISPESPLVDPFYNLSDMVISLCSKLINDENEDISWYVYECKYGKNKREAGFVRNMRIIDSFDQLRWLIETEE